MYLLLTALLSVLLTMYCIQQPQQITWNNRTIKYVNKPFKPKTNQLVRRRRIARRPRVLDSSSSSGHEPSTSRRPNQESDPNAQYSRPTPGPSTSSPTYHSWRRQEMNDSHHSEDEIPPPPYSSLRRSSASSRSSAQTIPLGEDSEEKQMLFRADSSDSD